MAKICPIWSHCSCPGTCPVNIFTKHLEIWGSKLGSACYYYCTVSQCVCHWKLPLPKSNICDHCCKTKMVHFRLVKIDKLRLGQVRLGQVRLGQVGLGQVRLGQIRLGQVRLGQVKFGYDGFSWTRQGLVRLSLERVGSVARGYA